METTTEYYFIAVADAATFPPFEGDARPRRLRVADARAPPRERARAAARRRERARWACAARPRSGDPSRKVEQKELKRGTRPRAALHALMLHAQQRADANAALRSPDRAAPWKTKRTKTRASSPRSSRSFG
eukprot:31124-Pelagococcus_subviridis.AAC.6